MTSMSCRLERAIWSRNTGQQIPCFDRCQVYLEDGRHLARLHRRRRRRRHRAYAPSSNTASHDNHKKINSWVSFSFLYGYGAPLGGPPELRYNLTDFDDICIVITVTGSFVCLFELVQG